jgi:hypothetical protein
MPWLATLGLTLLVYTPMAYLLLRGGYRRRMWAATVAVSGLVVVPEVANLLAGVGGDSTLATGAIVGWLAAVAALGFRPLTGPRPYPVAVTVGQVAVVAVVAQLLAGTLLPLSVPPLPASDMGTLAVTLGWETTGETLAVSPTQLHDSLFAVGATVFLLGIGNAHVHGPLRADDRRDSDREPSRRSS